MTQQCHHTFHQDCLRTTMKYSRRCPVCKREFLFGTVPYTALRRMPGAAFQWASIEELKVRCETTDVGVAAAAAVVQMISWGVGSTRRTVTRGLPCLSLANGVRQQRCTPGSNRHAQIRTLHKRGKRDGLRVGCSLRLGFKKLGCLSTRSAGAGAASRRRQARRLSRLWRDPRIADTSVRLPQRAQTCTGLVCKGSSSQRSAWRHRTGLGFAL